MVKYKKNKDRRLVVKFGGSSLADGRKISNAANMIFEALQKGGQVTVVVSAMGCTTDDLMKVTSEAANGAVIKQSDLDDLLSMGERISARLLKSVLKTLGVEARYFDPKDDNWPIVTNDAFGDAYPLLDECKNRIKQFIAPILQKQIVPIIPGFIGRTSDGRITTIGRGGSDTTAFILARYLNADEVVLATDVDGIMTADPKLINDVKPLPQISAKELAGLADSGTKFIHQKALRYIPEWLNVRVINANKGSIDSGGTLITGGFPQELEVKLADNQAIDMVTITSQNIAAYSDSIHALLQESSNDQRVLGFSSDGDSLIIYITSPSNSNVFGKIHDVILNMEKPAALAVRRNIALIRVEGVGLEATPGLIGGISYPLQTSGINIFGIFTVASSISVLVNWERRDEAITLINQSLHDNSSNK